MTSLNTQRRRMTWEGGDIVLPLVKYDPDQPRDDHGRFAGGGAAKPTKPSQKYEDPGSDVTEELRNMGFPNMENAIALDQMSPRYNCLAWACGDKNNWWWGSSHFDDYNDYLTGHGADELPLSDHRAAEAGYTKIAMYRTASGKVTHFSRQLPNGKWTSKIGGNMLIEHGFNDLDRSLYGKPAHLYKMKTDAWRSLRDKPIYDDV